MLVCSENKNSIVRLNVNGDTLSDTYPVNVKYPYRICVSKESTKLEIVRRR
ncbi:hypothetical protein DPMN_132121 [Dreissena polymorpha]|uniref:Uncharacterized protein n=1 Tax=Dreissena polymorpha TaxID=45954 RepID=A0A9D4FT86_DREPO|nr:hypothetical protein DPMN_132121 [Dreissena polymorpha]